MSYILNKTNGTVLATVPDGSIDQTTDLTFVGKNYAGYGEFINEDLLKLLENFANRTAPSKAIAGQLWYDTTNKKLKLYNGSTFQPFPFLEVSSTTPKNSNIGDLWFNTSENKLYLKSSSSAYTMIGPSNSELGTGTGNILSYVKDNLDNTHLVIKTTINSVVVSISSKDEFAVSPTDDVYADFPLIKKGTTIAEANPTSGVSSTNGYYFWGSAADSKLFDGHPISDFVLASTNDPNTSINLATDDGITVGRDLIFRFHANSDLSEGKITAINGSKISINLKNNISDPAATNTLNIYGYKIVPTTARRVDLGSTTTGEKFGVVYANTFTGTDLVGSSIQIGARKITTIDTDNTLAANSNSNLATQRAVKQYVDNEISSISSGFTNMVVKTASGSWTVPGGVTKFKVTVTGGGAGSATYYGAGCDNNSAGGSGGTAIKIFSGVTPGTVYTLTVGAAGTTSANGGTSSFVGPTTVTATGGAPGQSGVGGNPGAGSGGTLNLSGCKGPRGLCTPGTTPSFWGGSYGSGNGTTSGVAGIIIIEY